MALGAPVACTADTNPLGDTSAASTMSLTGVAVTAGSYVYLGVLNSKATTPDLPTISAAMGLTWTQQDTSLFNTIATPLHRLTVFTAYSSGALSAQTLTADFGGVNQNGIAMMLIEQSGGRTATTAILQSVNAEDDSVLSSESHGVTLSALGNGSHRAVIFVASAAGTLSAGTSMAEISEVGYNSPTSRLGFYRGDNSSVVTPSAVPSTTAAMGAIGMEIATPIPSAVLSGTVGGSTDAQVRASGRTIIITITDDLWVASGPGFDAIRQDIIDGHSSAKLRAVIAVGDVVRTSNTVVTITLTANAYDIEASESVTYTMPTTVTTYAATYTTSGTLAITPEPGGARGRSLRGGRGRQ